MIDALLILLALAGLPGGLQPVSITVEEPGGSTLSAPIRVSVVLATETSRPDGPAFEGHSSTRAGRAEFVLNPNHSWTFGCHDATRWCATQTWQPGEVLAPEKLVAWPKIEVRGNLRPPAKAAMPSEVLVQGWAMPDDEARLRLETNVEVSSTGQFSFDAPESQLELRFSAGKPYGPIYRWGQLPRDRRLDLGALELVVGASMTAFLVDGESGLMVEGAAVSWSQPDLIPESRLEGLRLDSMSYSATSDPRGMVQIHGIAPGTYRLQVEAEGRGDVEMGPFQIDDAVELHFEEIVLDPLATVSVYVQPTLNPDSQPWTVALQEDANPSQWSLQAPTVDGVASFQVPRGRKCSVILEGAETFEWYETQYLEVTGDVDVDLKPQLIAVEGTVSVGGEPLEARVRIQGGRRIMKTFKSDSEGVFEGWMGWKPAERFSVRVESLEERVEGRHVVYLSFDTPSDDDVLVLDLDLPDRWIAGRVLDTERRPVATANVRARVEGSDISMTGYSREDGSYRLAWLPEGGPVKLSASGRDGSASLEVADWGDGQGPTTDLVFRSTDTLKGRLTNAAQIPLANASLSIDSGTWANARTSTDGTFETEVLPQSQQGAVSVRAAGYPYWMTCVALPEEGPLLLTHPFQGPGGTLKFDFDGHKLEPGSFWLVVTADGATASISSLYHWASRFGGAGAASSEAEMLSIPALAPGYYALALQTRRLGTRATPCLVDPVLKSDWVRLEDGGEATLRVLGSN